MKTKPNSERWTDVTRFCENAGWDVIFDFNVFIRKNNRWDPRKAKLLLDYSTANNISVSAFQLGNEPNSYKHKYDRNVSSSVLVSDFANLRNLLNKYPRFKSSGLYGPDVTQLYTQPSAMTYFEEFIRAGGCNITDHTTFHQWLDKLGISALFGVSHVFRQSFIGNFYSLVSSNLNPNPDFYLSVLFKRLVDGAVLSVVRKPETMRVYANCASNELYPPGALVIYFINLRNTSTVLSLSQYTHLTMDLYLLTYGDNEGLRSRYVKLNGKLLEMTGTDLPQFLPQKIQGNISIEPWSLGFIVVSDAKVPICINNKKKKY
ncbi:hypothetical protein Btru_041195 [Bulinus truncatus]|nr:hypothetical protein Btru_041195 [Bulinus truncatus]